MVTEPDSVKEKICCNQGDLFEWISVHHYDVLTFANIFLNSDFCRRAWDASYSRFQYADEEESLDFLVPENPEILVEVENSENLDSAISYWMGYTYRRLCYDSSLSSRQISEKLPPKDMVKFYALHTIEEQNMIEIIKENKGIS